MSEHVILFAGPTGAGKTAAIEALSETPVVRTVPTNRLRDTARDLDATAFLDYGEIVLGDLDRVRLYGVPSQKRFEHTWRMLSDSAEGLVLLVNSDGIEPVGAMLALLEDFAGIVGRGGVVVCVTRSDLADGPALEDYRAAIGIAHPDLALSVLEVDPRDPGDMRLALLSLLANIELRRSFATAGLSA